MPSVSTRISTQIAQTAIIGMATLQNVLNALADPAIDQNEVEDEHEEQNPNQFVVAAFIDEAIGICRQRSRRSAVSRLAGVGFQYC